jgi:carbamoyltransferase
MIVLGLNCVFHESSAALVVDGQLIAAAEEERFNRVKHAKPAAVGNTHVLPVASIGYCLAEADVRAAHIDAVSYSFDPALRRREFQVDPLSSPGDWGSRSGEDAFLASLDKVPGMVRQLLGIEAPVTWIRHHLAHAASIYYTSCPDDAAVLVADGIGENATTVMFAGSGGELRMLDEIDYPHSLGFLWEKLSAFLGFTPYDASKVMGLAGFGDPFRYKRAFAEFVQIDDARYTRYTMDTDILRFRLSSTASLASRLGSPRAADEPIEQRHADIAATLQDLTNRIMLNLVREPHERHPVNDLGLAGGVALNCTTNHILKEQGPFAEVHIPSAPHDAGTAIGGALLLATSGQPRRGVQLSPDGSSELDVRGRWITLVGTG